MSRIAVLRLAVAAMLLIVAGAPARADEAVTFTAIALAESGGNSRATLPAGKIIRGRSQAGSQPGRPSSAHVAISLGDGSTIEAKGQKYGVGFGRLTHGSQGANAGGEDSRGLFQIKRTAAHVSSQRHAHTDAAHHHAENVHSVHQRAHSVAGQRHRFFRIQRNSTLRRAPESSISGPFSAWSL